MKGFLPRAVGIFRWKQAHVEGIREAYKTNIGVQTKPVPRPSLAVGGSSYTHDVLFAKWTWHMKVKLKFESHTSEIQVRRA